MLTKSLFKEVVSLPSISDAAFVGDAILVTSTIKDVELETNRDYHSWFSIKDGSVSSLSPFPTQIADLACYVPSPSGQRVFAIRKHDPRKKGKGDETPTYSVEVLSAQGQLLASASSMGVHGKALPGGSFGGVSWHASEEYVLYVAEPVADKDKDKDKGDAKNGGGKEGGKAGAGGKEKKLEWEHEQDWGEQFVGIKSPRAFVFSVKERCVVQIKGVPDNLSLAQPVWLPGGESIAFIGYENTPDRAGITYYNSRHSKLLSVALNPGDLAKKEDKKDEKKEEKTKEEATDDGTRTLKTLSTVDASPVSPRVSPDGTKLAFLTTDNVLYHRSGSKLRLMNIGGSDDGQLRTVVDVVRDPSSVTAFPGLWLNSGLLPARGGLWLKDSRHVVLSSCFRSVECVLLVDTASGRVVVVPPPALGGRGYSDSLLGHTLPSITVLDVDPRANRVLCSISAYTAPASVFLLTLDLAESKSDGKESLLRGHSWTQVTAKHKFQNSDVQARFDNLTYQVLQVDPAEECPLLAAAPSKVISSLPFEAILLRSRDAEVAKKAPLVVFPHGGPHSNFTTSYSGGSAFMACAGFSVLHINYRGSSGYGQAPLEALPGHCGVLDVEDCIRATHAVLTLKEPVCDAKRLVLFGGSHGGFLVTHLIGQYPDLFVSCVARNPVTNIAAMLGATDIPDWCHVEVGLGREYPLPSGGSGSSGGESKGGDSQGAEPTPQQLLTARPATADEFALMFRRSPIAHVTKVKTPLLTLVGSGDRRVPMIGGADYHKLLTARGVKTRMIVYPGSNHSLADKVEFEVSVWTNSVLWMLGHTDAQAHETVRL